MCDEFTAVSEDATLATKGLTRRSFGAASAASMLAACTTTTRDGAMSLSESMVDITTPDGTADAFFVHPAKGKYPGVILWPDVAGLRDAYKEMARRLAAEGYAVLAVNHYYRAARAPLLTAMTEWRTPAGQEKLKPAMASLSPANTVRDAAAFVQWLDRQSAVNMRKGLGTQGYCQTGSFAIRSAAALPSRIKVAASFHGGGLVTPGADSPHLQIEKSRAAFLIAIARNDDAKSPADKSVLTDTARLAGRPAEVEVYNADHGWCTLDAPSYDKAEADRAWVRLLTLYRSL